MTLFYTNRVFDVTDLPGDPEALKQWMYNLYYEKEDLLAEFYANGAFPNGGAPPRPLEHGALRYFALHIFFMLSSSFFWTYTASLRSVKLWLILQMCLLTVTLDTLS